VAAKRCSTCAINWPLEYTTCGVCEGKVDHLTNAVPVMQGEAKQLKLHADFERYLEAETDAQRTARIEKATAAELALFATELDAL
jgi:hypothetical protein